MKYRQVLKRYMLEVLVKSAHGEGYDSDLMDSLQDTSEKKKPMSDKKHEKIMRMLQEEIIKMRDKLIRRSVILDGVPLPWETEPPKVLANVKKPKTTKTKTAKPKTPAKPKAKTATKEAAA